MQTIYMDTIRTIGIQHCVYSFIEENQVDHLIELCCESYEYLLCLNYVSQVIRN